MKRYFIISILTLTALALLALQSCGTGGGSGSGITTYNSSKTHSVTFYGSGG